MLQWSSCLTHASTFPPNSPIARCPEEPNLIRNLLWREQGSTDHTEQTSVREQDKLSQHVIAYTAAGEVGAAGLLALSGGVPGRGKPRRFALAPMTSRGR